MPKQSRFFDLDGCIVRQFSEGLYQWEPPRNSKEEGRWVPAKVAEEDVLSRGWSAKIGYFIDLVQERYRNTGRVIARREARDKLYEPRRQ